VVDVRDDREVANMGEVGHLGSIRLRLGGRA
jgi:hypothetical protein